MVICDGNCEVPVIDLSTEEIEGEKCEHGVSYEELCEPCAHHPVDEWVGYPTVMCGFCQERWPCAWAVENLPDVRRVRP